ncbi:hypothetical protein [Acidocella sp. KAb 2-4]|uniref:hypothetical protein n=1 Tax=Acidocella sp. KAb 2-4 TaxID=2885158 RepID=UPI001D08ABC8|nr:hypothetical protein [Acidocella sp. KAb 2-4]MCB5945897.1 hypothetical protein [Acidocella sp. KAb 2-4]
MTIWFDVEDLIRFFQGAARPTGIQRFSLETCRAAAAIAEPGEVRFCARNTLGTGLREVDFPALDAAIASLANARDAAPACTGKRCSARAATSAPDRATGWCISAPLGSAPTRRRCAAPWPRPALVWPCSRMT